MTRIGEHRFPGTSPSREVGRVRVWLLVGIVAAGLLPAPAASAAGTVTINPGQSIQAAVQSNPEGTTFVIRAGVHRRQQVIPRDSDKFLGQPGAILDGEGVTQFAFGAGGTNVTVSGLEIRGYAPDLQLGVLRMGGGAYDWLVENNHVHHNRGVGIAAGPGWLVRNNYVHHQGQLGIKGSGDNITFANNEVSYNNTEKVDPTWEGGGSKFVHSRNLVIRGNHVHHNHGPGLWTDGNNIDTLFEGNRVTDNYGPGIFHEISYRAVIRNNVVERNGFGYTGWIDGAGILVGDSPNVEIYGNTVRYNNDGIAGKQTHRGSGNYGTYELKNLWVHHNTIAMNTGQTGVVRRGDLSDPVFSSSWNNRFDYNTYILGSGSQFFAWDPWYMTASQWRGKGQDVHSNFNGSTVASPPGAPRSLRGQPGAGSVSLGWTAPATSGGGAITDYVIQFRRAGSDGWQSFSDGTSTSCSALVAGLTNGATYEFRVSARNSAGTGPWSAVVRTRAGVPSAPRALRSGDSGTTRVDLAWERPAADNGAAIVDYTVRFRRVGSARWLVYRDGKSTATRAVVGNLQNGVTYEFKVAAKNSRGRGVWSGLIREATG